MAKFDARDQSTAMDSFCSFDGVDWVYQQNQSRPMRTRHSSSSALLDHHAAATKAPPIPRRSSENSASGATKDITSLNQLWNAIRQQKQRQMAKEPPKVNSLKTPTPIQSPTPSRTPDPVGVKKVVTPQPLKRRKSNVSFRESRDGRTITATFNLPGIKKNNAHVSYRGTHLTVTWETVKITEIDEGGTLVREREKKEFSRTIPLPEGTKFEEVGARMDDRYLILTYPNMRSVRVEPRQMGHRQVEPRRIEPTEIEASDVYEY